MDNQSINDQGQKVFRSLLNIIIIFCSIYFILIFFGVSIAKATTPPPLQDSITLNSKGASTNSDQANPSLSTNHYAKETKRKRVPKPEKVIYPKTSKQISQRRKKKSSRKKSYKSKGKPNFISKKIHKIKKLGPFPEVSSQTPKQRTRQITKKQDLTQLMEKFIALIPKQIDPAYQKSPQHFIRNRKLPFPKLIVFLLSIVANGKNKGIDTKSAEFVKSAKRSGLWPEAEQVHRSAVTKGRKKVDWKIFKNILHDAVDLAYVLFPEDPSFTWHGMSVFAVDGSTYILPSSDEIRQTFDPTSGLENMGRGHYPECLISTVYDVFRRIPLTRTVVSKENACERTEAKNMMPYIPSHNVILFDRGYPSYELIDYLRSNYDGYFIFRCPATNTFPSVETFIKSKKQEGEIFIDPSNKFLKKVRKEDKKTLQPIKLRIIKLVSYDGKVSVLLTNLFDKNEFSQKEIIDLYFKRWEIENHYRDEKVYLEIEKFHSKTCNGIQQELFAVLIMTVIAKTLMVLSSQGEIEPQFKNSVMALAYDAAVLAPEDPERAIEIFKEVLKEIARVKYYRPKKPRPSQPRVTKKPNNKWVGDKIKKSNKKGQSP
jgi:hypothetical protein